MLVLLIFALSISLLNLTFLLPSDGKNACLMWRIWACDVIILETIFAVIIAGAVAPSRVVGQMHAGSLCLSA